MKNWKYNSNLNLNFQHTSQIPASVISRAVAILKPLSVPAALVGLVETVVKQSVTQTAAMGKIMWGQICVFVSQDILEQGANRVAFVKEVCIEI